MSLRTRALVGVLVLVIATTAAVAIGLPRLGTGESSPAPHPSSRAATPVPSVGQALQPGAPVLGPAFGPLAENPTRTTTEHKVWSHGGRWFAVMWAADPAEYRIHVLDQLAGRWVDTGVFVDDRRRARADVLPEGDGIVIATASSSPDHIRDAVRITGFVWNAAAGRYVLQPDYPVTVTPGGADTISMVRDGSGRLWLATAAGSVVNVLWTLGDDHRWAPPVQDPAGLGPLSQAVITTLGDGIALIATPAGGADALYVATHRDADPVEAWTKKSYPARGLRDSPEPPSVVSLADASAAFVAVRTTLDRTDDNSLDPLILVYRIDAGGSATSTVFGRVTDRLSRPVLAIDETRDLLLGIAVQRGERRTIRMKASGLSQLAFPTGVGSRVVESAQDGAVDDPSTTRQPIDATSGLLVLASDETSTRYVGGLLGLPNPSPLPPLGNAAVPLVNDRFESWALGSAAINGWAITTSPAGGRGEIRSRPPAGGGQVVALESGPGSASMRACREFRPITAGQVEASIDLRVSEAGGSDPGVWFRGAGEQTASVRLENSGVVSYYDGQAKVESTVPYRLRTWYRIEFRIDIAARTYAFQVVDVAANRRVLNVRGASWRSPASRLVDEICVDAPRGLLTWFDTVTISRVPG